MSEVRNEFIRATYSLSKVSPDAWATFVEAFKASTLNELERMSAAPPEAASYALGFGRKMVEVRDDFINIETLMHKIKGVTR